MTRLVLCFGVVGFMAAIGACKETTSVPPLSSTLPVDSADQVMMGVTARIHESGLQRAIVLADTAYFLNDQTTLDMRGVSARFFTSTGVEEGQMTARRAIYDTRTRRFDGFGDVVLRSVDGRRLTTSQIHFDQANNRITSDSAFTMTEPDRTISGVGFETDPGMNSLRIHQTRSARISGGSGRDQ
jgi:LPS export ABC transporter protein LptC